MVSQSLRFTQIEYHITRKCIKTWKVPEKSPLREFFGSELLKNEKLPKNLSFSGVYGGFSFAV